MYRIRFILTGAVFGIAWACSLRGFMQQLAGADSTFTFAGTFGVIIPAGTVVGALLGWAEYQRRAGRQHRLLILAPPLIGIIPVVFTAQLDIGPIALALLGWRLLCIWAWLAMGTYHRRHHRPRCHTHYLSRTQALP